MPKSKVRNKKKKKPQKKQSFKIKNNIKMSEVILDYISPFVNQDTDYEKMENIIAFGILIWNLSLTPAENRQMNKLEICEDISNIAKCTDEEAYEMVEIMLRRKHEEFGNIRRFILDYDISYNQIEQVLNISSIEV